MADVRRRLDELRDVTRRAAEWIQGNCARDERNLFLHNLVAAALPYLDVAARESEGPTQVLAFCTRSIFELELRAHHLLHVPDGLEGWKAEFLRDSIEILEGLLTLRQPESESHAKVLEVELQRLRTLGTAHGVKSDGKLLGAGDLARAVGRRDEYVGMFKLYSKLVHPTAYSVNKPATDVQGGDVRNVLLVQLQLYAWSLLGRVGAAAGIPDELMAQK
ncbi:MAG: hypothetical protein KIT84_43205 [Labilithrix sp.]|nr:hypothetical protein [Labilithrix sp.]MCW5817887.1 hypothetical protein [Labilithrix sp.]